MLKILLNLIMTRATATDWQLQLGAHLLKKGCGFYVGQIIKEKKIGDKRYRVSEIGRAHV